MQYVVAVSNVASHGRFSALIRMMSPRGCFLALQHPERLGVGAMILLTAIRAVTVDQRRIRRVAQQPLIQLDLADEIHLRPGACRGSRPTIAIRDQIDRREPGGGGVDFPCLMRTARSLIRTADPPRPSSRPSSDGSARQPRIVLFAGAHRAQSVAQDSHVTLPNLLRKTETIRLEQHERHFSFCLSACPRQFADIGSFPPRCAHTRNTPAMKTTGRFRIAAG